MKIEANSPILSQVAVDRSAKRISNGGVNETEGATVDRTTFHSNSTSIHALTSQALNSPEIRQDKVNALRQSVASGEYKIDASKIAGAILDSDRT
jgi:flagellar biosynthesis anti-sigma factor FlgM